MTGAYEAVHAYPDGDATVARFAKTASEYGFDGVVVRNHGDEPPAIASRDGGSGGGGSGAGGDGGSGGGGGDFETVRDRYGVDVVAGVEVRAGDPSRASGFVGNHRDSKTVVAVHGGTRAINRFAVEQPAVDVLTHPMAGDGDVNHVLAKAAAENGVRLEFSFARVLRADGGRRVQALRGLRKLRELVDAFDVPYVVSADPESHLQVRAPRELVAVGEAIGFDAEQVERGLAEWGRLAERNRRRTSDEFVEPGVYRGRLADIEDEARDGPGSRGPGADEST